MTEHSPVTALDEDECWAMLRDNEFGRLAFHLADEVHIVPINYAVDADNHLVFRTAEGSKLLGLTMNADVAFEIDDFTDGTAQSVVVRGRAHKLEGPRARAAEQLSLAAVGSDRPSSTSSRSRSTRSPGAASTSSARGCTCDRPRTTDPSPARTP